MARKRKPPAPHRPERAAAPALAPGRAEREAASARATHTVETPSVLAVGSPLLRVVVVLGLLVLPWSDRSPLGFLPSVERWALVLASSSALLFPLLARRGVRLPAWMSAWGAEAAALTVIFGTFFLLKLPGLHPSNTDENIYFYMAWRLAHGAIPYRDFFFAHPPIHLVVPALIFRVFGFSIGVAKAIPVLAQAAGGLFLYLAARRASRPMAALALLVQLSAYDILMGSTDMDGENLMTMFLAAAVYFAIRRRSALSGAMAALALGTGMYALAGVVTLAVAAFFTSPEIRKRFALGLGATFGGFMSVFFLLGGSRFVQGVFTYHFAKTPTPGSDHISLFESPNPFAIVAAYFHNLGSYLSSTMFKRICMYHAPLLAAFFVGVGILAWRSFTGESASRRDRTKIAASWYQRWFGGLLEGTEASTARLGAFALLIFTLQWAGLNELYDFYTVPMFALASLAAGFGLLEIHRALETLARTRAFGAALATAGAFALHVPMMTSLHEALWPEEQREAGQVVRYEWRRPYVFGGVSELTRRWFFRDSRIKGEVDPTHVRYLWNKLLTFSTARDIADYVRANSAPDETITGASTLAPLVALLADRRMSADEADTNNKRFRTGLLTDHDFWELTCRDRVRFVLSAQRSHFNETALAQDPTLRQYFRVDRVFEDAQIQHFTAARLVLYRRIETPGLEAGRVCYGM